MSPLKAFLAAEAIATVLFCTPSPAAAAGPPLPSYNIEQECRGAVTADDYTHCRTGESLALAVLQRDPGPDANLTWNQAPADLRNYCLTYFMPRWIAFNNNTGDGHHRADQKYGHLITCISTNYAGEAGGPTPWLDPQYQPYMGQYKHDTGHYTPGWRG